MSSLKTPRVIYLPIEEIQSRYGQMMNQEIRDYLTVEERELSNKLIPSASYGVIGAGFFLDVVKTSIYKAEQMRLLMELIGNGDIRKRDIIFFHDIFYPGIEGVKYVSDLTNLDFKIVAFNYAGRADPEDFVQWLGPWADSIEIGWHRACDEVLVGSHFHKNQILKFWPGCKDKLKVTGYPYNPSFCKTQLHKKEDYCIWPHRICREKGLLEFLAIARALPEITFLVSSGGVIPKDNLETFKAYPNIVVKHKQTKAEYHTNLAKAKWFLSTAKQETFGYALHEAADSSCIIAASDKACNSEFVPQENLFHFDAGEGNVPVKRLLEIFLGQGPTKLLPHAEGNTASIMKIVRGEV